MDNSKVLKPIIGPQESEASKKKESNKKKKALIVSALAFLIATGTIAASIAVVKANMPKLEIKFDQWFVDSFDFESMQAFIDENRLSKGDIDKRLPGYVDKKAKDQNVKNADMITNARLTNKIPESNKLPHGIYVEMTAETEYAFTYQSDLSLEDNNENTKELSSIADEPKKQTYFISKDKSKLYVLVYERESDSDEATKDDLQTFNDFNITNTLEAYNALNKYIAEQSRRYTEEEFTNNKANYEPGLEIFYNKLIGFEKQYISKDTDAISFPEENGERVVKIKLDIRRSNFYFDDNNSNVKFEIINNEGFITISGLNYFTISNLNLTKLHTEIQDYIKEFDPDNNVDRRYTLEEFRNQMGDNDLKAMILKSVGILSNNPITLDETITDPDNPGEVEPEEPTPPTIDTSKLKNMYISDNNLVIDLECDANQKYGVSEDSGFDPDKYSFDQVNNRLTVKNLKYFIEYDVSNTQSSWDNLNNEIVDTNNQYTIAEFTSYAQGIDTQEACKQLIAKGLRANNNTFDFEWIKKLSIEPIPGSETKIKLKIEFDTDFKKYKTNDNEQYRIDSKTSSMEIQLTCFKEVEMINLQHDIQEIINSQDGPRYTIDEFNDEINKQVGVDPNELQEKIKGLVEASIQGVTNISNFNYSKDDNKLKLQLTIPAYDKFPPSGSNIEYKLVRKNSDYTTTYEVTIMNLEYWFDFSITAEELRKTKSIVGKFILQNNVYLSDDPDDEGNYKEYEKQIYDLFGKTPLENGMLLSEFMTYSETDFQLVDGNNFFINLKPKFNSFTGKLRNFKLPTNLTEQDGIEMSETNKTITFKKFEFGVRKDYFFIEEKEKAITGVTNKGRKQSVLRTLDGYSKIKTTNQEIDGYDKKILAWNWLENLNEFYISDDVEEIMGSNFIFNAKNLEHIKISRNMIFSDYSNNQVVRNAFYKLPKLQTIDWNQNNNNDVMNCESILTETNFTSFIFPRNVIDIKRNYILNSSRNLEWYIAWFNNFRNDRKALASGNTLNLKHVVILSNDFTFTQTDGYYNAGFFASYIERGAKIYVTSENFKQKMINNKKDLFGAQQVDTDKLEKQIIAIPNLEKRLINDGVIPSDW